MAAQQKKIREKRPILRLQLVAMATSLKRSPNECKIYQSLHSSTNPEILVKINSVVTVIDLLQGRPLN